MNVPAVRSMQVMADFGSSSSLSRVVTARATSEGSSAASMNRVCRCHGPTELCKVEAENKNRSDHRLSQLMEVKSRKLWQPGYLVRWSRPDVVPRRRCSRMMHARGDSDVFKWTENDACKEQRTDVPGPVHADQERERNNALYISPLVPSGVIDVVREHIQYDEKQLTLWHPQSCQPQRASLGVIHPNEPGIRMITSKSR